MFGFNTRTTVLCRNGIVLLLLFPLYLLARFALWLVAVGRVFYKNELPGKRRGTGGSICGSVEVWRWCFVFIVSGVDFIRLGPAHRHLDTMGQR